MAKEIITDELLDLFAEKFFKLRSIYKKEGLNYPFTFEQFVEKQLKVREMKIKRGAVNG